MPSFQNTSLPRKKAGSGALAVKEMGGELNAQCPKPIPFSSHIWRMVGCAAALAIAFALYARSEKKIDRSHELRHRSFLLADELRQSSDDLTRMVRTYVITGDPIHKQHYQDILDIRDGKKPRPEAYARIYWDLVLKGGQTPRPDSKQSIPLLELMRQAGFTEEEFQRLGKAKANSDGLTILEFEAMKLVGSGGPEAEANRAKASRMLHDANYHQAKAAIMKPIDEFDVLMDERTLAAVQAAGKTSTIFRYVFVAFGLGLMFALWRLYAALSDTLGGSVDEVYAQIARIGSGDFSATIRVKAGRQNSVLAWLSEMQAKLNRSTQESKQAEAARDRLAIIIESTTDLVGVTDAAGNHLYLNRAGRNLLGVGLDEDITKTNSADFVPSPASHRSVTEGIPTAARLGIWSGEIVLLNRSGQEFPVSQVILAHKTAQGEVESFSTIMRDITARKRAEQRIADELNYSHTMLEASPLGIITYTAEGAAVSVNPAAAQVVGATVPQLGAQNFRSLESWKRSGMFEAADHALKTSQPQDLEAHFVTSFGKSVWLSCRFVPFRHKDRGH
ncbi:MAG TPA: PAS domain S-box protein, partial [Methylomirabilota bacterium]|nr:PAS domain S-box protein [Methylomirabilota bacterium]